MIRSWTRNNKNIGTHYASDFPRDFWNESSKLLEQTGALLFHCNPNCNNRAMFIKKGERKSVVARRVDLQKLRRRASTSIEFASDAMP